MKIKLNNNRVNLLSKSEGEDGKISLSIHRGFVGAPSNVWEAIFRWAKKKATKEDNTLIRTYINHSIDVKATKMVLEPQGKVYHLREIFDEVNDRYFDNQLDLDITWFNSRSRKKITLGQYRPESELICINRRLDNKRYPRDYVGFVVYHEMLHHVVPPTYDKLGRARHHNPEFRRRERLYHRYDLADSFNCF